MCPAVSCAQPDGAPVFDKPARSPDSPVPRRRPWSSHRTPRLGGEPSTQDGSVAQSGMPAHEVPTLSGDDDNMCLILPSIAQIYRVRFEDERYEMLLVELRRRAGEDLVRVSHGSGSVNSYRESARRCRTHDDDRQAAWCIKPKPDGCAWRTSESLARRADRSSPRALCRGGTRG